MDLYSFIAGACYGFTSVIVGQPFDTIKTRMQAIPANSQTNAFNITRDLFMKEGIRGLYRGGLPPFIGGSLFRSAQFGFYENTLKVVREHLPAYKIGYFDYQVFLAGLSGGIGRGLVEGPFEFIKVRRQVERQWNLIGLYRGSAITMLRNCILFSSFVLYIDLSKSLTGGVGLSPFWTGAICSNMAWLTIWPLDVVKSRIQSGNYGDKGIVALLKDVFKSGAIFRGVLPGLMRSTFANGCSMVVYQWTYKHLKTNYQ